MNLSLGFLSSPLDNEFQHQLQLFHQLLDPGTPYSHTATRPQLASTVARAYVCTGGSGSQVSMTHTTSMWGGLWFRVLAAELAWGLAGLGGIQRKKETIQHLESMSSLEVDNRGTWRAKSRHTWRRRDPKSETRGITSRSQRT